MGITKNSQFPELKTLVTEMNRTHMSLGEHSNEMINLFLSFDIVNSTRYKSMDKDKWSVAISRIIRRVIGFFSNNPSGGYDFWKTLGDEIIYTRKIGTVQDLLDALEEIYNTLNLVNQNIAQGGLLDEIATEMLSLKAATWLADLSSTQSRTNNVLTYYQINDKRRQADYIGPDIDTGFRAAHYSMSNRMVISFDIACLLMRYQDVLQEQGGLAKFDLSKRVHLLTCKELKGVWDGQPYPILLYHGDANVDFDGSITQDERDRVGTIQEYLAAKEARKQALLPQYTCAQAQALDQLCHTMRLDDKIHRLMDLMERTGGVSSQEVKALKRVCYSAVCYTLQQDTLQFVLVKNKDTGLWGFGEASFFYGAQFVSQTEKAYHDNFGIDIAIENDTHYYARIPLEVSLTKFAADYRTYTSHTVFLGRLTQDVSKLLIASDAQLMVLSEADISSFQEQCIPYLPELLQHCARKIHEINWEKHATRV